MDLGESSDIPMNPKTAGLVHVGDQPLDLFHRDVRIVSYCIMGDVKRWHGVSTDKVSVSCIILLFSTTLPGSPGRFAS